MKYYFTVTRSNGSWPEDADITGNISIRQQKYQFAQENYREERGTAITISHTSA